MTASSDPARAPARLGATVAHRLIAGLRLQRVAYDQVAVDTTTLGQVVLIVLLTGVCNGIGLRPRLGDPAMWAGVGTAFIGWFLWTFVLLVVARLFGQRRGSRSLLRTLGLATAPGVLLILGVIPEIAGIARKLAVIWLLAATVVAVEATYVISRRRAVAIALAAFLVYAAIGAFLDYLAA